MVRVLMVAAGTVAALGSLVGVVAGVVWVAILEAGNADIGYVGGDDDEDGGWQDLGFHDLGKLDACDGGCMWCDE